MGTIEGRKEWIKNQNLKTEERGRINYADYPI